MLELEIKKDGIKVILSVFRYVFAISKKKPLVNKDNKNLFCKMFTSFLIIWTLFNFKYSIISLLLLKLKILFFKLLSL